MTLREVLQQMQRDLERGCYDAVELGLGLAFSDHPGFTVTGIPPGRCRRAVQLTRKKLAKKSFDRLKSVQGMHVAKGRR